MTLTFNRVSYGNLLSEVVPQVIETEEEYDRLLEIAERLTFKQNQTPEESALYKLLVQLIEVYEAEHYPMEESAPHEVLAGLLETSPTSRNDLVGWIGSDEEIDRILSGEQPISQKQAELLGRRFKVSPDLFLRDRR